MNAPQLPQARAHLHTTPTAEGVTLHDPATGEQWPLQGLGAQVWACLDGRSSVDQIAQRLSHDRRVSPEQVWSALDALADLGLLAQRAAPPADEQVSLHRPLGRRAMAMMGLAAAAAPMAFASTVANEDKAKADIRDAKTSPGAAEEQNKQAQKVKHQEADQKKNARAAEQKVKVESRAREETQKVQKSYPQQ